MSYEDPTVTALKNGTWQRQPTHVEPSPPAGPGDPLFDALAGIPQAVPVTPVPDVVRQAQQVTLAPDSTSPVIPQSDPVVPIGISDRFDSPAVPALAAPQPAPAPQAPEPAPGPQTATQPVSVPAPFDLPGILWISPDDVAAGHLVFFNTGPLRAMRYVGDGPERLWVMEDCTLRSFAGEPRIGVIV